jgi:hypothetical protein
VSGINLIFYFEMNELRNLVNVCEYKDIVDDGIQTNEIVVRVCALL